MAIESPLYLNNIVNAMTDPLIVVDLEMRIKTVNKAAGYILGYKEKELIGRRIETFFAETTDSAIKGDDLAKMIRTGMIMNIEAYYSHKDGRKIPVLFSSSILKDEKGNDLYIVCTAKDITQRKRVERELEEAYARLQETQDQLIQSEKLKAVGQLAGGVAHEVRNPLGVILQGVEYLEKKLMLEDKDTLETMTIIKDGIKRANGIISSLLDFSKMTKLTLQPEDVNTILESSLTLVKTESKVENIEIVKEMKKDIPKVMVDKNRIEQVFINIFLNAIHSIPGKGKLIIRSYDKKLEKIKNGIGRREEDIFKLGERAVMVEIEDTGVGISKESLKRVFDPFFTTKIANGGTGLGLSVTRTIIEMHKGLIDIESRVDKGTKVTITLKTV